MCGESAIIVVGGDDMKTWRDKYATSRKGGICDFEPNYEFYFKWLLNKAASCFVVDGLPDTINQAYLKTELLLDGVCCITDFGGDLYACTGSLGGQPDEYYVPTVFVIANPVLGSKQVKRDVDGVCIFNTAEDELYNGCMCAGLYQLINQTATLLSDNIISINACQINARVCTFFTADSEPQQVEGEAILKEMYAGKPFRILRSDIVEKITVNPVAIASTSQSIVELVELHNYIISNFMQSIGIRANNEHKRERMVVDEIAVQNDYLQLSVLEILASWKKGFDKVNEMYGTDISVSLNPALIDLIAGPEPAPENAPRETIEEQEPEEPAEDEEPVNVPRETIKEQEPEEPEAIEEELEKANEEIGIIAEYAAGRSEENENQDAVEGQPVGEHGDDL